jgi:putative peptide zinc metalloprotease protein
MTDLAAAIGPDSVVAFHPLARRADGPDVVIGRKGSDVFVSLPHVGADAIALLDSGATIAEVEDRIEAGTGERVDVAVLAAALLDLGMVAAVDGRALPAPAPARVTLPRLGPEHVGWLLHRPVHVLLDAGLALLVLAAVVLAVRAEGSLPGYESLLWTDNGTLVLATQVVVGWSLILVHEAAHLITARAAGVPGRVEFGTRLQFLVAQTNVTGIWAAPLRHRLAVYSAGMRTDLAIGAFALLGSTRLAPGGVPHRLALVVAVLAATGLIVQLLIFMRTDVYFIVQDLTGSRNLYGDSAAYARYLVRRAASLLRPRDLANPLAALDNRERRTVQGYTVLLVAGTAVCLAYAAVVLVPFAAGLVLGAVAGIASGRPAAVLDGAVVLAVQGALLTVWSRAWWARHGHRLTPAASR